MPKLKSHKTVEQIAKKHRLDVSFIQKQLDMGEPIEHEHTKDHDLAKDIALQHLDEIPDYYSRLKKMETDAKKHHKKFKDVTEGNLHKWFKSKSKDGKPGWVNVVTGGTCASDEPGEGVPKCVSSSKRASMSKSERLSAARRKKSTDPTQQQKTGAAKPTYVSTDKPKKAVKEEWSDKYKKSIDCDNPKGFSQRAHCQGKKKKMNEESDKKGKGSGKKDACYHKVKARYDVWPSAYASGALVKCRQKGAANWGTKSESASTGALAYDWDAPIRDNLERYCPKCKKNERREECRYGVKYWDMFSLPTILSKDYDANSPHPGNMPESKDHEHSMARSELQTIISAARRIQKRVKGEGDIEAWVQSKITKAADYLDSAADYIDSGEMKVNEQVADTDTPADEKNIERFSTAIKAIGKRKLPDSQKIGALRQAAQIYRGMREDITLQDLEGNNFVEIIDVIKPEKIKGTVSEQIGMNKGKKLVPNCVKKENYFDWKKGLIDEQGNYVMPKASQTGAYSGGDRQKGYRVGDTIPSSASKPKSGVDYKKIHSAGNEYGKKAFGEDYEEQLSNWREEISEDWQKVNRQDKTDGLSQKAVNAYRRENPGSKLQTAVTEKKPTGKRAKRRSNFCSRMKGMKSKLTSAKTSRDPDSRINKALRRWNCN